MKLVEIYRSKKKEGMYLYVEKGTKLEELPEALLKQFGMPEFSMVLKLSADRKLAQVNAENVLDALVEKGFYIQFPPTHDAYMQKIPNDKIY